jgi:signal transduction histidine kinase
MRGWEENRVRLPTTSPICLIGPLELDFAFVRLCNPTGCQALEVIRGDRWKGFPEWLQQRLATFGKFSRTEIVANIGGDDQSCSGIVIPIGVNGERGIVAAASNRSSFPDQIDQQLLSVAANNAATAFQNAFLINEQLARQFEIRMEERVGERTRIARELHDTLLQSVQGLLLKLSAVTYMLPDHGAEAQKMLESVIEQARQAVVESRDTVQGLRSSTLPANEIAQAIRSFGEELAASKADGNRPDFCVQVEGEPRDLAPLLKDEVYRIGCEALRNAFQHACASRIEVEIHYDPRRFRLRVRDNGKGIDPEVLEGGRAGHYGLASLHERAKTIGGNMAVWCKVDSGTEVELTIPASLAYAKSSLARQSTSAKKPA